MKTMDYRLTSLQFLQIIWLLFVSCPLYASEERPYITLTTRQHCDLELLMDGSFSPLESFLNQQEYDSVVNEMRLPDGSLWPIPIILDIDQKTYQQLSVGMNLELRDSENTPLAILHISDIWQPDKRAEAIKVYNTLDISHPGVNYLFHHTGDYYIGGQLTKLALPKHYDFNDLRKTPAELRDYFKKQGTTRVIGFQTRNPLHRAHVELTKRAINETGAHLLIHPAVGMTKSGDIDHFTRVKCYQKALPYYPQNTVTLSLLPLSMRMAGPREAVWHALIRKNYGCTHFIVGRDHSGPGKDGLGRDFYLPYEAQQLALSYSEEIGIKILPYKEMVYVKEDANYQVRDEVEFSKTTMSISGTTLRAMLQNGEEIPDWFSFPEVIQELRKSTPIKSKQGFAIFFTGLSGAGKSTLANALLARLLELQDRPVTLLDGDCVRKHLSSELSYTKEHRSLNVRRIGYVAQEIVKNHGATICALIAPYDEDRLYNRSLISSQGNYIEVYVSTPLEVCKQRDPKGLYELAKTGKISNFTGISDPYEIPTQADITLDTATHTVETCLSILINYLKDKELI